MRLSLAAKMFAALFGISVVMVGLVVAWTGWDLDEGFSAYVSAAALTGMDRPVEMLEENYALHGNWSGVAGHPAVWEAVLHEAGPPHPPPEGFQGPAGGGFDPPPGRAMPGADTPSPRSPWLDRGQRPPGPPDGMLRHLRDRLALVDAAGEQVGGTPGILAHPARRAIMLNNVRVGDLLFDAGPLPGGMEAAFMTQRFQDLYAAGGVAILLSGLAAMLLARHILAPIRLVTAGARQLASGDFSARIDTARRDELGALVTDFNALAVALEAAEQSRRLWVADTSHELRTPLAVLRAQIEALQDGVQPVSERSLATLHGEVLRMTQLVGDLHELSRADSGALALHLETVEPGAIMAEVLANFSARREARGLRLETGNLPAPTRHAVADPDRLRQVFANVVENAIRYTDSGGVISVAERFEGKTMSIIVQDSAPGVPPAKLPRVFERFYRVENSRNRETGGSGLGLSICKAIMEAHAGSIAASASPLGGLAVTITLPTAREAG